MLFGFGRHLKGHVLRFNASVFVLFFCHYILKNALIEHQNISFVERFPHSNTLSFSLRCFVIGTAEFENEVEPPLLLRLGHINLLKA